MTKTAVVTGASSGIGAATARALAGDSWHVICAARRVERIEPLSAEIGGQAVVCDVTSDESVTNLVKTVGGKVDLLVNNAGGAVGQEPVTEADLNAWTTMYQTNVLSCPRSKLLKAPSSPSPPPPLNGATRAVPDTVLLNLARELLSKPCA